MSVIKTLEEREKAARLSSSACASRLSKCNLRLFSDHRDENRAKRIRFRVSGATRRERRALRSIFSISYDWSSVVRALFNRYPNPINPSVVACDVIDRRLDAEQRLHSHRLLTADWNFAPALRKFFAMIDFGYASEHSTIDWRNQRMISRTRNLIFSRFVTVEEHLELTPLPSDPSKTLVRQALTIDVEKVPLKNHLETLISETMTKNAIKVTRENVRRSAASLVVVVGSASHRMDHCSNENSDAFCTLTSTSFHFIFSLFRPNRILFNLAQIPTCFVDISE